MTDIIRLIISLMLLGAIGIISTLYNQIIDNHTKTATSRFDGDVIVLGLGAVGYTVSIWGLLNSVWSGWPPTWFSLRTLILCLIVAAVPLYFGEVNRRNRP